MAETNPFILLYDALWELLESYAGFTDLVRLGNRIKFSGDNRAPVKQEMQSADLPEVRLVCTGGTPHVQRTSGSSSCTKTFSVQIATGDQRYNESLFPVEWAIYKAMARWQSILGALIWEGESFVKQCQPVSSRIGLAEFDVARGIKGWTSVWEIEIDMWFSTAILQA